MCLGVVWVVTSAPRALEVFILAGQSNTEAHARVETFDYIGDELATAQLPKLMRDPDRSAKVRMPISENAQSRSDATGKTPPKSPEELSDKI